MLLNLRVTVNILNVVRETDALSDSPLVGRACSPSRSPGTDFQLLKTEATQGGCDRVSFPRTAEAWARERPKRSGARVREAAGSVLSPRSVPLSPRGQMSKHSLRLPSYIAIMCGNQVRCTARKRNV